MPNDLLDNCLHLLYQMQGKGKKYAFLKKETSQNFFQSTKVHPRIQNTPQQALQSISQNNPIPQTHFLQKNITIKDSISPSTKSIIQQQNLVSFIPEISPTVLSTCDQLEELKKYYETLCQQQKIPAIPFNEGSDNAPLMVIGEAPILSENDPNALFSGPAGELLKKMLTAIQPLYPQGIYQTTIVKTPLSNNHVPNDIELKAWLPLIKQQIQILNPKVIILLGNKALQTITEQPNNRIGILRGQWLKYQNIPIMPIYHPLYIVRLAGSAREKQVKLDVWNDLKLVMSQLGWDSKKNK